MLRSENTLACAWVLSLFSERIVHIQQPFAIISLVCSYENTPRPRTGQIRSVKTDRRNCEKMFRGYTEGKDVFD